ncbi:MAG: PLP-dependent aminotransferase family protein, partial [Burkholderiales bacterium]|nr:PLP-dependent aminotransferase family protein [Burkholderiales bacterium]
QRERCAVVLEALARHAPQCSVVPVTGGGSCWLRLPGGVSATALAEAAAREGVLIEPGDVFFHAATPPAGFIRLGYQSIPAKSIEPGIALLAGVIARMRRAGA